jgi:serine protease Do
VDRNGETRTLNVTIKERSSKNPIGSNNPPPGENQNGALNGVAVANLDNQNRAELRIPAGVQGALITNVDQNSPAYDAGLRPGDVITEINHQPVRNADDAVNLTQKPSGGQTLVKVWRDGGSRYVAVP